jgi:VIT1/CCC1 family predicted Fe2+/Mn2+ transporter
MMKHSMKTGLCFGLTSAIITTLGLIVGLHSFSGSKLVVIGGILTIAIADAFSDALGIHVSEEAENIHTDREIWESTLATFGAKFLFALTFMVPVFLVELSIAIMIGVIWGLLTLTFLSYIITRGEKESTLKVIVEHLVIALTVISITHYVGDWVSIVLAS